MQKRYNKAMKKIITLTAILGTALLTTTLPTQSYADKNSRAHTHDEDIEYIDIEVETSTEEFIEETAKKPETATERRKRRRNEVRERLKNSKEHRRGKERTHSHH